MALTHEELFLLTLQDIRNKSAAKSEYELLRACGLCRQLFVDKVSLYRIVNAKYQLPLECKIVNWEMSGKFRVGISWFNPDPTNQPQEPTRILNINQFKNYEILTINQHPYKVLEIIKGACNYMGGVHAGEPLDEKEKSLASIDSLTQDKGTNLLMYSYPAICNIITKAMIPLENAIRGYNLTVGL